MAAAWNIDNGHDESETWSDLFVVRSHVTMCSCVELTLWAINIVALAIPTAFLYNVYDACGLGN